MKFLFLLGIVTVSISLSAQKTKDFNTEECRDMLALCNSYTFRDLYGTDTAILPKDYKLIYQSPSLGMDNMYQLYIRDRTAVINFRGSTAEMRSWWANLHAAMIPAEGKITGDFGELNYRYAVSEGAAVHSGYGLALVFITQDLRRQLDTLKQLGATEIIITGHSQGGALANLLFAIFHNQLNCELCDDFTYRVYAFAAPMVGNSVFCKEYRERYCETNLSYNIINIDDPVPRLPIKFNDTIPTSKRSRKTIKRSISFRNFLERYIDYQWKGYITREMLIMTEVASSQANKYLEQQVVFPSFINTADFDYLGNIIQLDPFDYPKILKDSSNLENNFYSRWLKNDRETRLKTRFFYKRGSWGYQHKPYNYYIEFLRTYHREEYKEWEPKYLKENL